VEQGGGWYDRALLHRRPGVPVLAMVYEGELLEDCDVVPVVGHDVPVDGVITPAGVVSFSGRGVAVGSADDRGA
jgi:5-formyltetrahydrofolate cyclo-ligase